MVVGFVADAGGGVGIGNGMGAVELYTILVYMCVC